MIPIFCKWDNLMTKIFIFEFKSLALREISEALTNTGEFNRALEIAEKIPDYDMKSWALNNINKENNECFWCDLDCRCCGCGICFIISITFHFS